MTTFTLSHDDVKSALIKANQIIDILDGKASRVCIDMGWSKVACYPIPLNPLYDFAYGKPAKYPVYGYKRVCARVGIETEEIDQCSYAHYGNEALSYLPILTVDTHYTLEAARDVIKELSIHTKGDALINSNFQASISMIETFDINSIDISDLIGMSIVRKMIKEKEEECAKALNEYIDNNKYSEPDGTNCHQTEPEAPNTKPIKKKHCLSNCALFFIALIGLMLAIFNPF